MLQDVCERKAMLGSNIAVNLTRENRESVSDDRCFLHGGRHDPKEGVMRSCESHESNPNPSPPYRSMLSR
jgi:hypothetical protein